MYILKNALLSIKRNKERYILIGIIVMVIGITATVALAIRGSANTVVEAYEEAYQVEATLSIDRSNMMSQMKEENQSKEDMIESFSNMASLTEDEINSYGDSEYVSSYYYTKSVSMNGKDLDKATSSITKETTTTTTTTMPTDMPSDFGGHGGNSGSTSTTTTKKTEIIQADQGDFTLVGYSSYEAMSEFINGSYTLTSGEISSDFTANNCLISEELATLNEVEVGDTITLVDPNNTKKTYTLTVTGIYKETEEDTSSQNNMFSNAANQIITNTTVVSTIAQADDEVKVTLNPTYILTSTDVVDAFKEEVTNKGLATTYTVQTNEEEMEQATSSIQNVKSFATALLIIVFAIGAIVLFVINKIHIHERRYEIGVLRTIGMKKSLVSLEFTTELLIVTLAGLLLGAAIGAGISVPVANSLLANEISSSETQTETISNNFGGDKGGNFDRSSMGKMNGVVQVSQVSEMNAVINPLIVLELLGIGLLLTLISSTASMIAIARFSPITILKERS